MSEHVILKHLLVAVQRELLAAHGADFPVALHVLLKLALVVVGWEDDLTQWTALHVHAVHTQREKKKKKRREKRGEKACVNKASQVMMWANQAHKEHLSDATWVACCSTNTNKKGAVQQNKHFTHVTMHRFRKCRVQQTWMAFMRV